MSKERTDSAEQMGVGESVLVLDLYLVLDWLKAWIAKFSISTNNQCQNPWYTCGVFKSFLLQTSTVSSLLTL